MTITDPRQPVFIKKGNRYIAIGSLGDFGTFSSWHSEGLWLHTRTESTQRMTKIADLTELPCTAALFAAVAKKRDSLVDLLRGLCGESDGDIAAKILEWIAKGGEA